MLKSQRVKIILLVIILLAFISPTFGEESCELDGDVGLGYSWVENPYVGSKDTGSVTPYLYFDWCRFTTRINIFALKTIDFGYGSLEITYKFVAPSKVGEELTNLGIKQRKMPIPIGLGTYQVTPYGLFAGNILFDMVNNGAALGEVYYGVGDGPSYAKLYLTIGEEYSNGEYNNAIYGVNADENEVIDEYEIGETWTGFLGLFVILSPVEDYRIILIGRRYFTPSSMKDSPIVREKDRDSLFLGVAKNF